MGYGVFRWYPPLYKSPRRRVYTMPRSPTRFVLPDPSEVDTLGRRKHHYFVDVDLNALKIEAKQVGHFIQLDGVLSASGGYLLSSTDGATCHVIAVNDTLWVVQSYTGTWGVV